MNPSLGPGRGEMEIVHPLYTRSSFGAHVVYEELLRCIVHCEPDVRKRNAMDVYHDVKKLLEQYPIIWTTELYRHGRLVCMDSIRE